MGMRIKLFTPVLLLSVGIVIYVNAFWLPQIVRLTESEQQQQLQRRLAVVAESITPLLANGQTSAAAGKLDAWARENGVSLGVELRNASGQTLYVTGPKDRKALTDDTAHTFRQPVVSAGRTMGELMLHVDANGTTNINDRQQYFLYVFVGVVLAFAIAATIGLELAIRRPIGRLSQASARLAAGDFQAPLPPAGADELGVLARAFDTMREAIKRYQEDLSFQATHDPVTSLVNRREFERRLHVVVNATKHERSQHALIYMDLDQFRVINDTCGHTAGDAYLRQVGGLLHEKLRKHDTLGRLGGDEFGVLLEHCPEEHAIRIANELFATIQGFRFIWEGRSFTLGVSIGVVFLDEHSESLSRVLSVVDAACFAAKDGGRNRIHVYRDDDSTLVKRHGEMQWVSRITEAVEQGRFHLYYQLIVPVGSQEKEGVHFEFLLRMQERNGKIIPPGSFLPAAERYNLMLGLDRWVTQTAFEWLANHPEQMQELGLCTINLSGHSLGDADFMDFMIEKFNEGRVPPEKICFEITETAAIGNLMKATRFMSVLKSRGCCFSLDDFGSGLSSFAYLKNLPVDYLKIDGIFVKDIVDDPIDYAMVKAINEMGHVMGKRTVAEFVEKDTILVKLREIGVDYAQGYGIAKPRPLVEMDTDYIRREMTYSAGRVS
jgi:diguanylate cyclase (GGDEF)-like protein